MEESPEIGLQNRLDDIIAEDVLSALVNLGYKNNIAKDALDRALRLSEEKMEMDKLLKKTLKLLAG
jgi:Holliday junction DNA helicase RuvA